MLLAACVALAALQVAGQAVDAQRLEPISELPAGVQAALNQLSKNVATAHGKQDANAEAQALDALGNEYLIVSEYRRAQETYMRELTLARSAKKPALEAAALNGLGNCQRSMSQMSTALDTFKQALDNSTAAGDLRLEAEALNGIGWIDVNMSHYQEGLDYHTRALAIADKLADPELQGAILNRIGVIKDIQGDNQGALDYYGRALAKWREASDRDGEAKALNNIGIVNGEMGVTTKALEYYKEAQPLYHQAGDRAGEAAVLNNLGVLYRHTGDEQKALDCYQRVLSLERALGSRSGEATALNNLGNAYSTIGENQKALELFNQSLAIEKELKDSTGQAGSLHNIGELWVTLGNMQKALDTLQQALAIWSNAGEHRGEANTLNAIGIVYDELGQPEKAFDYYLRALDRYKEVGDPEGAATVANNFAGLLNAPGQKQKALEYYTLALNLLKDIGNRDGQARTLNNMGLVYQDLGQRDKALDSFEQALSMWREVGNHNGEAQALNNIGGVWDDAGERDKARDFYAQALPITRAVSNPMREAQVLHNMMLNEKTHAPALAVFYGKQAVNLVQHARGQIQRMEQELQRSFLASKTEYYRDLAALLIAQGRLPEGQQVLDLLKEQEYADFVRGETDAALKPLTLTPMEQRAQEDYEKSTAQIVSIGEEWMRLKRNNARTLEQETAYQQLSDKLNEASKGLNNYYARLYTAFGNTPEANKQIADVKGSVSQLKQLVGKEPHMVALYTLVSRDRYSVIVITGSTAFARDYAISAADLNTKVAAFQQVLRDRAQDPKPLASELYKILIGPVAADLEQAQAETLVWSLDGSLRYLPIAALYDGHEYVVERYRTVTITPESIAHLAEPPDMSSLSGVAMGISKKYEDSLPALPSVANELNDVISDPKRQEAHGDLPGTILLNGDFTERSMENLLERPVSVVHIASHFVFKPGDDNQSYLLLAGQERDGTGFHLTIADFRDDPKISLEQTDLLTLSACETGMSGTAGDGREVDGLGTTAQLKGAKAVISSLWEVNDASTAALMADFYRRWVSGAGKVTKAEALREAQLDLLRGIGAVKTDAGDRGLVAEGGKPREQTTSPGLAHPYYWAPFVLMGNWK